MDNILYKAKSLDALRFIGAICVVLFHYNKFTGTAHSDNLFPFYAVFGNIYSYGSKWVEFFFLLSGFTFFAVYEKRINDKEISFISFIIKRIIRLFPLYYFSTLCVVATVYLSSKTLGTSLTGAGTYNSSIKYIIINMLGIGRGWLENESYPYNGPAWTLSVEIFCYLIFYVMCRFVSKSQKRVVLSVILSLCGFIVVMGNYQYPIINHEMGRGVACFFFGGVLYNMQCYIEEKNLNMSVSIVSTICILICFILKINLQWPICAYIIFPSLLLLFLNSTHINSFFRSIFWVNCGNLSYSIYLNQVPVMSFLFLISGLFFNFNYYSVFFWVLYLTILILFSIFTNKIIEKQGKVLFQKFINVISKN